jgi:hypothetical protein
MDGPPREQESWPLYQLPLPKVDLTHQDNISGAHSRIAIELSDLAVLPQLASAIKQLSLELVFSGQCFYV